MNIALYITKDCFEVLPCITLSQNMEQEQDWSFAITFSFLMFGLEISW